MTGEITLRGRVLPIGGLKEKVLAAHRAGVNEVLMPKENVKDIEEIPENIRQTIKLTPVSHMDEVFKLALVRMPEDPTEKKMPNMVDMAQAADEAAVSIEQ